MVPSLLPFSISKAQKINAHTLYLVTKHKTVKVSAKRKKEGHVTTVSTFKSAPKTKQKKYETMDQIGYFDAATPFCPLLCCFVRVSALGLFTTTTTQAATLGHHFLTHVRDDVVHSC